MCQSLRILSFSVTQLPAPNYHCRTPEPTAIKAMPEHWWGHFYIQNLKQQVSCSVVFVLAFSELAACCSILTSIVIAVQLGKLACSTERCADHSTSVLAFAVDARVR